MCLNGELIFEKFVSQNEYLIFKNQLNIWFFRRRYFEVSCYTSSSPTQIYSKLKVSTIEEENIVGFTLKVYLIYGTDDRNENKDWL